MAGLGALNDRFFLCVLSGYKPEPDAESEQGWI